jgi:hypothetical protein
MFDESIVLRGFLSGASASIALLCLYRLVERYKGRGLYFLLALTCIGLIFYMAPEQFTFWYFVTFYVGTANSYRMLTRQFHRKLPEHLIDLKSMRAIRIYSLLGASISLAMIPVIPNLPLYLYRDGVVTNGQILIFPIIGLIMVILLREVFRRPNYLFAFLAEILAWIIGLITISLFSLFYTELTNDGSNRTIFFSFAACLAFFLDRFAMAVAKVHPSHAG